MSEAETPHEQAVPVPSQPVLVGYDGSTAAGRALAWGAGLARRIRQPLLAAYVSPPPTPDPAGAADPTGQQAALLDWLRAATAEVLPASAMAGVELHAVCRSGDIATELAQLAEEHHAEALVLGAPEHRLHRLFGSVSTRMVGHAHCPVIIVP